MVDLVRPEDLKKIGADAATAKAQEDIVRAKKLEEEQKSLREAFMKRDIEPTMRERFNASIRRAAAQGNHEFQLVAFPASYCNDDGRSINNNQPEWPASLEGFAKQIYAVYDKELRPLGYKLRVEILNFPGGMLGNVGMFLRW